MPPVPAPEPPVSDARIVAQMRPALVKYFRRKCGSLEEAEDLAQEVLVRALGHVSWSSPQHAQGYIFRAAINLWRDRKRRAQIHGETIQWSEGAESGLTPPHCIEEKTPERVLISEQILGRVARALAGLSERARDILLLTRLEQMKQSAVAEVLGVSVSTVEKDLVKALAHLARCAKDAEGSK